jgi:hypothetical protein
MKTTATYWHPVAREDEALWEVIDGSDGNLLRLTIAEDPKTGDYTRLTRFRDGYSADAFGARSRAYPEEIFVLSGRLCDAAVQIWLEPGHYASRPPLDVRRRSAASAGGLLVPEVFWEG